MVKMPMMLGMQGNKNTLDSCILTKSMLEWTTMNKIDLHESGKANGTGKRRRAKLIAADVWGSSAYYPAAVLERDAEDVFVPGTKMYENHFTESEEYERPEGDVSRLIGKLVSYGVYEADNPEGPGVYADVEFYDSYVDRINEIGEDVGLSVRGTGASEEGEVAGRYGKIVTQLLAINSVDVVTAAGAGGKLVSILESAGPMAGIPIKTEGDQSVTALTKDEFTAGIAELKESFNAAVGEGFVTSLTTALKEALKPEPVPAPAEPAGEEGGAVEGEPAADEVEVDHAELATKFAESGLPVAVMPNIVTAVKEGKTIAEAIESQTKLREAFAEASTVTTVRITEADRNEGGSLRDKILSTVTAK